MVVVATVLLSIYFNVKAAPLLPAVEPADGEVHAAIEVLQHPRFSDYYGIAKRFVY